MKVNILIDNNNIIKGVQTSPITDTLPLVEINSLDDIHVGYDSFIDGQIIHDIDSYEHAKQNAMYFNEIIELKHYLNDTDYMAIKHMDGALSTQEYSDTKQKRQKARDRINELEALINNKEK